MISNKIIGYALLIIGLVIIFCVIYQSYNIFMDKTSAPLIFKTQIIPQSQNVINQDLQKQLNDAINQQFGKMIPVDTFPKILNLFAWSLFAGILVVAGGAISGIGVKLLK